MVTATLYIEGGGDGKELRIRFREGWNKFFDSAGVGAKTKIVRGGGRQRIFDRVASTVSNIAPETVPILLVDSEASVNLEHSTWAHLYTRDGWAQPEGAGEDGDLNGTGHGNLVLGGLRSVAEIFRRAV